MSSIKARLAQLEKRIFPRYEGTLFLWSDGDRSFVPDSAIPLTPEQVKVIQVDEPGIKTKRIDCSSYRSICDVIEAIMGVFSDNQLDTMIDLLRAMDLNGEYELTSQQQQVLAAYMAMGGEKANQLIDAIPAEQIILTAEEEAILAEIRQS